ncbi:TPA: hypothetical protein JH928_000265 [Acinetobacter baumannii]|nr:hypothetical protein [Acinetobacter baumannii]
MAAATQNTDETLASTDEQATTKPKNTRNKTNKTTETQNTQAGDEKASDQGDLLNSQGPEDGASQDEGNKPTDLKNGDSDNEESNTQENGNPTETSNDSVKPSNDLDSNGGKSGDDVGNESDHVLKETDTSKVNTPITDLLTVSGGSSVDPLVIKITNGNPTETSNDSVKPSNDLDSNGGKSGDDVGNESDHVLKETDTSKVNTPITDLLTVSGGSSVDPLVIKITNNGFSTVLEPLSRVAIEAGKTASITCHNQTFKHQVLENLRQLKGLGKNLTVE